MCICGMLYITFIKIFWFFYNVIIDGRVEFYSREKNLHVFHWCEQSLSECSIESQEDVWAIQRAIRHWPQDIIGSFERSWVWAKGIRLAEFLYECVLKRRNIGL